MKSVPTTKIEAVNMLLKEMSPADKNYVKNLKKDDLVLLHHTLGRAIRNNFELWAGNQALLKDVAKPHPDDAAMVIIRELWNNLNALGNGK